MPDLTPWWDDAACVGWPPELFMASQRGHVNPEGQAICDECPVRGPCLADGWWDEWTTRGGLSPGQRRAVRRYVQVRLAG